MKDNKIVSVAGFGSTGSSAVVNYLEEFKSCRVMGGEFRLIQDPDGLEDLCSNLTNAWGWNRSDAYIRRFIKYTNIVGRRIRPFIYGEHLNKSFNYKFFKHRDEFINNIVDTKWKGHWFYHDYHERNLLETFIENLKRSLSWHFGMSPYMLRKITKKSQMYYVRSDMDVYSEAQKFLYNLFNELNIESEYLVFDQLILPYHKVKFDLIFPNLKQIVVDRDPRDVYLDSKNYNAYPITQNIDSFISFYESSRLLQLKEEDDLTLKIQFEDLIYNYENTTEKINKFVGINLEDNIKQFTRLNPDVSINNTKTWEKEKDSKVLKDILTIEKKLKKWCYNFK